MLFNEAEVLAAIEAADQAHAARTSQVEAHVRKRAPDSGRKAIPEHFPRIVIENDLPAEAKLCTKCDQVIAPYLEHQPGGEMRSRGSRPHRCGIFDYLLPRRHARRSRSYELARVSVHWNSCSPSLRTRGASFAVMMPALVSMFEAAKP